jgi:hypothetical protein
VQCDETVEYKVDSFGCILSILGHPKSCYYVASSTKALVHIIISRCLITCVYVHVCVCVLL